MGHEIRADYSRRWLFPPSLEDWVPEDHPARFVREFVDSLDLAALGFAQRTSPDGRPNYAADLLLKVWLFGYLHGIRSLRQLERACRENVGLLWLTGLHEPDHNTLWRFWRDNRSALRALFKQVVRTAAQAELIGLVLHAVDGTKVTAQGSKDRVRSREKIEEALRRIDESVEAVVEQIEAAASGEDDTESYRLPADWRERMLEREELRELAGRCEIEQRKAIHPLDRDARFMKTRREGIALAYNAQAVSDGDSGLIVAGEVIVDETDNNALAGMIEQARENAGQAAEQTVADAGYHSGAQLQTAEERGYAVVVAEQRDKQEADKENPYDIAHFRHDAARDCCVCPEGKELRFEGHTSKGPGRGREEIYRRYRCAQFADCPVRRSCSRDSNGRTVSIGRFHGAIARQREKRQTESAREILRRRKAIIEPVFGVIKEILGFRRFTVRGIDNVRTQWSLVCIAYDLRKLFPFWKQGKLRFAT